MSSALNGCTHVVDTHGLLEIAALNTNEKTTLKAALKAGAIAVPAIVWKEFEELYEDEAADLKPHISAKISMKGAYQIGAASIADKINSTLIYSPYDSHADLCTAAICQIEGRTLLTNDEQLAVYAKMKCRKVESVGGWLAAKDD